MLRRSRRALCQHKVPSAGLHSSRMQLLRPWAANMKPSFEHFTSGMSRGLVEKDHGSYVGFHISEVRNPPLTCWNHLPKGPAYPNRRYLSKIIVTMSHGPLSRIRRFERADHSSRALQSASELCSSPTGFCRSYLLYNSAPHPSLLCGLLAIKEYLETAEEIAESKIQKPERAAIDPSTEALALTQLRRRRPPPHAFEVYDTTALM